MWARLCPFYLVEGKYIYYAYLCFVGSGSTYIYGHCDATYKPGMTKEQCFTFVSNGLFVFFIFLNNIK